VGVSKFAKLGLPRLWGPIILSVDLWLIWGLKQSYKVVGSQIANLIPNTFFYHNLCFRCPNGSCEPISNIYIPRTFQWYMELLNPMRFDPCNHSMKIRESIGTPTPKMGIHLGVWGFIPSHSFALSGAWNVTPGLTLSPHSHKPLPWSRVQG